ncbi:MAG: hypothetical protein J3K34DRAFT_420622 [Monoraphidium minutum]|nr:MAG: hypothetical protein J3K34DRAFT_420622 [Monoraphidium minutum]
MSPPSAGLKMEVATAAAAPAPMADHQYSVDTPGKGAACVERPKVVIFEVAGGTDKGADGHRIDTAPIVAALEAHGMEAEVLFFSDAARPELVERCVARGVSAFMMRVNPGCPYDGFTDASFMAMGRDLHAAGVVAVQHPDVMLAFDPKASLFKLRDTPAGLPDTGFYVDRAAFDAEFPARLAQSDRVLKQNRGCTGEGVWLVRPHGWQRGGVGVPGPDALVEATEMVDNSVRVLTLAEFMDGAAQLAFKAEQEYPGLLDQPFLPRITEGEVRVFMVRDRAVCVLHKKPAEGSVSATLFSGAKYTTDAPDDPKWHDLLTMWRATLPQICTRLAAPEFPLFWCADFIPDAPRAGESGDTAYRLGELNASCVGFSTARDVAGSVASEVLAIARARCEQ